MKHTWTLSDGTVVTLSQDHSVCIDGATKLAEDVRYEVRHSFAGRGILLWTGQLPGMPPNYWSVHVPNPWTAHAWALDRLLKWMVRLTPVASIVSSTYAPSDVDMPMDTFRVMCSVQRVTPPFLCEVPEHLDRRLS